MAANLRRQMREQLLGERAAGDARGRLARRSALQNVAQIARAEFLSSGEVCMAGTRAFYAPRLFREESRAAPVAITSVQLAQSLFSISNATGEPSVRPWRTPLRISARSRSIFMRPPRP